MKKTLILLFTIAMVCCFASCTNETKATPMPKLSTANFTKIVSIIESFMDDGDVEKLGNNYSCSTDYTGIEVPGYGTISNGSTLDMTMYPGDGDDSDITFVLDTVLIDPERDAATIEHIVASYSSFTGIINYNGVNYLCDNKSVKNAISDILN